MRKKLLTLTLVLTFALALTACGKSKEEKELEAIEKELEEAGLGELSDFEKAIIAEELALQAEKEAQAEVQGEYKVYDSVAEWNTVEEPLLVSQIDDTLYELGVTVEEFLKQVDSSSIEYEIGIDYQGKPTYTEEMIVEPPHPQYIEFCRDGAYWFRVYYYNPTDSIISINDCICYRMECSEAAYEHVKVLNMSYDEWCSIKYDEVETKMQSIETLKDCEVMSNQTDWTYSKDIIKEINGKRYLFEVNFIIKVDTTTGKIYTYGCNIPTPKEYYDYTTLESLDNLSDEAWNEILEKVENIYENNKNNYSSIKVLEIALMDSEVNNKISLKIYCMVTDTNGMESVKVGTIYEPQLADGKTIVVDDFFSLYGTYESLENAKTYTESREQEIGRITF